jgi:hypothetical protein
MVPGMDRARLEAWLNSPHRTWRWKDPSDRDGYQAVETSPEGLRWYAWSHLFGEGRDGPSPARVQGWAEFRSSGPAHPVPPEVRQELEAFADAHGFGAAGPDGGPS